MSARQAARWKRAACPALARDSFSKSSIWRRNQGFGSHLGGLRVRVAQSSRWALAAPSARFAPSGASEPPKRVVPPQKWWPSVVAGTSRSSSVTAPPASKCGCGVCPAPQARAKRAPRATRATPAQAFRASLRRKKRGLPLQQAHRAIAPFALPPRQALPRLPLKRRARHTAPRARKRFECPKDTRNASRRTLPLRHPGAIRPAPPVRRFGGLADPPNAFRIQRHARWIRQPCVSKASLRRPPPGEPAALPPAK